MSHGSYSDKFIELKNTYLLQYELGREVPALIQLLSESDKAFDLQWRTVMTRIVGLIAGRRKGKATLLLGDERLAVMALIAHFIFHKSKPDLTIHTASLWHNIQKTALTEDVVAQLPHDCEIADLSELMRAGLKTKGFLIAVFHEKQSTPIRQVIDHFSKGNPGVLLVIDYARHPAESYYQHVRELGLRMVELPDGSGELICT